MTIERKNRELAVILSIGDYERMRAVHLDRLKELGSEISAEAKANGLTEEILKCMLAEE